MEQAERERAEALKAANRAWGVVLETAGTNDPDEAEARLAKVPALVEALRRIEEWPTTIPVPSMTQSRIAREALAAWEPE